MTKEDLLGPKDSIITADADEDDGHCRFHRSEGPRANREDYSRSALPENLAKMFGVEVALKKAEQPAPRVQPPSEKTAGSSVPSPNDRGIRIEVVSLARIRPMKGQPRDLFDTDALHDLAMSIGAVGNVIPMIVMPVTGDPQHDWQLIDGERRLRSAKQARKQTAIVIVLNVSDPEEAFEIAAIANLGREPNTPLEMAKTIKRLHEKRGLTPGQIALRVCRSETYCENMLRMLRQLDPQVVQLLEPVPVRKKKTGQRGYESPLNIWVGWRLMAYPKEDQIPRAHHIVKARMSHRQAVAYLDRLDGKRHGKPGERYKMIPALLASTEHTLDVLLGYPDDEFNEMFGRRTEEVVGKLQERLEVVRQKFKALDGRIAKAKK